MLVAFRVCEKLRRPLTTLAGAIGFQSLMLRALTLAKRGAPSLSAVEVTADGSLQDGDVEPNLDNHDGGARIRLHSSPLEAGRTLLRSAFLKRQRQVGGTEYIWVVSQFESRDWVTDLWYLVTPTMRRADSLQPHLL
jgi:hypothetical protein